jgi:hypothetical protein
VHGEGQVNLEPAVAMAPLWAEERRDPVDVLVERVDLDG